MSESVMIEVPAGDDVLADFLEASGNLDAAMRVRGHEPVVWLWRLSQVVATGYDTYDSCVVAALDEASAKRVHPSLGDGVDGVVLDEARQIWIYERDRLNPGDDGYAIEGDERTDDEVYGQDWARHPAQVVAVRIGATTTHVPGAVVCASFNAG